MVVKYKTNRKGKPLALTIGIAFILSVAFLSPNVHLKDPDVQKILALFALVVVYAFFGISIVADDTGIYKIDPFIFKRGLLYDEIQEVWYYQLYKTGGRPRVLAIKGIHNGREKIAKLGSNGYFSEQTLSEIIIRIHKRGPNAQLDGASEELMRSGSGARLGV